jgi:methylglutaconyl-CoA hydratase
MSAATVRTELGNGVFRVILARPDRRNALDDRLVADLSTALETAERDRDARVLVLMADGRDFCAGADLAQTLRNATTAGPLDNLADAARLGALFIAIRRSPKVVIAAVQGRALAGGAGLATACDLVLATDEAEFGYPEIKLGLVPAMVGAILRRVVGEKVAFELLARGARLSAGEALRLGLVNQVFPAAGFADEVDRYARELASHSPDALQLIKRLLYGQDCLPFEDAIGRGAEINVLARSTADARAGMEAFINRKPR